LGGQRVKAFQQQTVPGKGAGAGSFAQNPLRRFWARSFAADSRDTFITFKTDAVKLHTSFKPRVTGPKQAPAVKLPRLKAAKRLSSPLVRTSLRMID
jgi:hypothetical protein